MDTKLTPLDPWIAGKIGQRELGLTRDALEAYQLDRLRETLAWARTKSPFYAKHLSVAPRFLATLEDLTRFPFTDAQDIREEGLQLLCVSQDAIQRVVTLETSGTTGQAKRLYFTKQDQELTIDFFQIGMSTFTNPGDRVLILLPGQRPGSVGDLLAIALRRLGAAPIKHGPVQDVAATLEILHREKAECLVGIPAQVLALARYNQRRGLQSVLLTTDHVPQAIVRAVEGAWGCTVYNHYGTTEMGLGGGVECQGRRGYHLREADLYFEIVDPATGVAMADGEKGEIVFTTLTRRGMPLIRYRTGDLGRFITGPCTCGTVLKTLERVRQRINGNVEVGDGHHVSMADLDEILFSIKGILDFSAALERAGKDSLNIKVSVMEETGSSIHSILLAALESIPSIRYARKAGQLDVVVTVHQGPAVARPSKRTITDQRAGRL